MSWGQCFNSIAVFPHASQMPDTLCLLVHSLPSVLHSHSPHIHFLSVRLWTCSKGCLHSSYHQCISISFRQPLALTYCLPPWTDDPGMKQYRFFFLEGDAEIVWIFLSDYCERKRGAVGLHRGEVKCRASAQQSLVGGSEEYSVCWSMLLGPKWMGVSFHTFINSQISAALEKQPEGVNSSKLSIVYNLSS